MTFGNNFLPTVGWVLNNATIDANVLLLGAGGTATLTITNIEGANVLPEGLRLDIIATAFPPVYAPTAYVQVHIEYIDSNTFDATAPIINNADGACLAIFTPTISNYDDFDVSIFSSISFTFYSSVAITLTKWECSKSLSDALLTDTNYYGIKISTEKGFCVERNDGASEAVFNSDTFAMRALVDGVMKDKIYFDPASNNYIFDGTLSANIVDALSVLITPNLYADKATVAEITVDQLDTSDKVKNYLVESTEDVNFIKIFDQNVEFITSTTDGSSTELVTNRNGEQLYWVDDTYEAASTEVTEYPVTQYVYTDYTKLKISFVSKNGEYVPVFILGTGTGTNDNGKFFLYKETDGTLMQYTTSNGTDLSIHMSDEGYVDIEKMRRPTAYDFSGVASGSFTETVDGGQTTTYSVSLDGSGRISTITDSDGHATSITWE